MWGFNQKCLLTTWIDLAGQMAGDIEQEDVFYECRDWAAELKRRKKEIAAKTSVFQD